MPGARWAWGNLVYQTSGKKNLGGGGSPFFWPFGEKMPTPPKGQGLHIRKETIVFFSKTQSNFVDTNAVRDKCRKTSKVTQPQFLLVLYCD